MATTTPNYGWDVPTSTDYVKDGATAIETLGDDIDATLYTINGGSALVGLQKVTSTSFSAQSSVSVNNCFTSAYSNYRIIITATATGDLDASFRFRASGSDASGANYQYAYTGFFASTSANGGGSNATAIPNLPSIGNGRQSHCIIDITGPNTTNAWKPLTQQTAFTHSGVGIIVFNGAGVINSTTQFDGFTIFLGSGTMTGNITVYGYRN
jgi:hypothetical protein